ncbi:MAG: hypothetical protein MJB57_15310 [Gemmatimonadetes bacterium]|nr:hypothetical protein [Gemmatimonadota bacterium]
MNNLLATPAQVRLLRVLTTQVAGPITAADAAKRALLTEAGARRALQRLSETGVVRIVGGGHAQQFGMRETELLTDHLTALFRGEHDRYQVLMRALREAVEGLPDVRLAWIEELPIDLGDPLHIGVLADPASIDWLGQEVRRRITSIEEKFELTIEIHALTRADMPEREWASTVVLCGVAPTVEADEPSQLTLHSDRDRRALLMTEAIRELLNENPSLTKRAVRHLEHLLEEDQGSAEGDLREWHSILSTYSHHRLVKFLMSDSPRAERLRQSSPFFAVLTPEERDEVLAHLKGSE